MISGWVKCADCGTVVPEKATKKDDSGPLGLVKVTCSDRVWCLERLKAAQAEDSQ